MKVFLGTDHAGFELKEHIKKYLQDKKYEVEDCGALALDKDDDYPDFIGPAAKGVVENPGSMAIVFGKSGAGEAMAANKIKGARAVLCFEPENVVLAREHNDANVLSLGSGFTDPKKAEELVQLFIDTKFSKESRHERRIEKMNKLQGGDGCACGDCSC